MRKGAGASEKSPAALAEAGKPPIQSGVTNHSLRRTFASLGYADGKSPAYVMDQMGHTSAHLALEVYAKRFARGPRDTGAGRDALIWGPKTEAVPDVDDVALVEHLNR